MPLLSPTQHPLLPKTLHAHGPVAMNVPLLNFLHHVSVKNNGGADGTGFYVAPGRHLSLSCQHLCRPGTFTLNCFQPVEETNGEGFTDMLSI